MLLTDEHVGSNSNQSPFQAITLAWYNSDEDVVHPTLSLTAVTANVGKEKSDKLSLYRLVGIQKQSPLEALFRITHIKMQATLTILWTILCFPKAMHWILATMHLRAEQTLPQEQAVRLALIYTCNMSHSH